MNYQNWLNKQVSLKNDYNVVDDLLNSICAIKRVSTTANDFGEEVETWTDAYTDIPCLITNLTIREQQNASMDYEMATHHIYFKKDQDITDKDEVESDGFRYKLRAVQQDSNKDVITCLAIQILMDLS